MIIIRYTVERRAPSPERLAKVIDGTPPKRGIITWLLNAELKPCSERVLPEYTTKYSLSNQILWWLPRLGAYLQYVMGTAIFSSLAFVPISDAFPIIVRYGVSAIVARCILGLELQSLKHKNRLEQVDGMVTVPQFDVKPPPNRTLTFKEIVHVNELHTSERHTMQRELST